MEGHLTQVSYVLNPHTLLSSVYFNVKIGADAPKERT